MKHVYKVWSEYDIGLEEGILFSSKERAWEIIKDLWQRNMGDDLAEYVSAGLISVEQLKVI